jgi:hypothetical protein
MAFDNKNTFSFQRLGLARYVRAAIFALAALTVPLALPARAGELMWGANGHPFTAYPGVSFTQQLDLLAGLGAKSYRVNVTSVDHVPALGALVAMARDRGLQILPLLTPPVDLEKDTPQVLYAQSFNFAVTIASRFKNDVAVWELGNELETYALLKPCEKQDDGKVYPCSYGIAGGMTPLEYAGARWKKVSAVLKGLSDGIVSVSPKLKKAMGTAGWGHFGAFNRMQADGIAWDITVWHAYREEADEVFERLAAFKKPIWITEVNHPYGSHKDGFAAQADGLRTIMSSLLLQRSRYNIDAVFFYELLDEPYWTDYEGHMGLVTQLQTASGWVVGEKKPAYEAVRQAIAAERGLHHRGCELKQFDASLATSQTKVSYAYCLVFGHRPDGKGLQDYAAELDRGMSVEALLTGLTQSDWFVERHRPADRGDLEFVDWAYRLLLGREADGSGRSSYVAALRKGETDRRRLLAGIVASAEFRDRHTVLFAGLRATPVKAN